MSLILNDINDYIIDNVIKYIIIFIIVIIIILTIICIINFNLYTLYSVNAIFKENIYETSIFLKLKDIYNFMLINYIYKMSRIKDEKIKLKRIGESKLTDYEKQYFNKDIDNILLHIQTKDDYRKPEDNDIIELSQNEANVLKSLILTNNNFLILKSDYNDDTNIKYYKYEAIYYKNEDSLYNIPELYDNKASYLYLHISNKLYEFILLLILIIIIIVFLVLIYETYILLVNYLIKEDTLGTNIIYYLVQNKTEYIILLAFIIIFCISHSIIYKNIFIDNVYNRIYNNIYLELIKPDDYVRGEIDNIYTIINIEQENNKKEFLYENNFSILESLSKKNVYMIEESIIDINDIEKKDKLDKYLELCIQKNKSFKIYNYERDPEIKKYLEHILNKNIDRSKNINSDYISSSLFIYIIYSYFIHNNEDDPNIINKLNKILFNERVIIGDDKIDEDIEYTLLLRSLLNAKLDNLKIDADINTIKDKVITKYREYYDKNIESHKEDKAIKILLIELSSEKIGEKIKLKIDKFNKFLKETNNEIDFGRPVYYFNLYLALELAFCFGIIILILMIIYNYSGDEKIKQTLTIIMINIIIITDNLKDAILGVI